MSSGKLRRARLVQVQLQHGGGTIGCVVHDKLDKAVVPRRNETIKRVVRDDHDGASVLRRRWQYVAGIIGHERERVPERIIQLRARRAGAERHAVQVQLEVVVPSRPSADTSGAAE